MAKFALHPSYHRMTRVTIQNEVPDADHPYGSREICAGDVLCGEAWSKWADAGLLVRLPEEILQEPMPDDLIALDADPALDAPESGAHPSPEPAAEPEPESGSEPEVRVRVGVVEATVTPGPDEEFGTDDDEVRLSGADSDESKPPRPRRKLPRKP